MMRRLLLITVVFLVQVGCIRQYDDFVGAQDAASDDRAADGKPGDARGGDGVLDSVQTDMPVSEVEVVDQVEPLDIPSDVDTDLSPPKDTNDIIEPDDMVDIKDICVPDCESKECGDDGCGGSCGMCIGGTFCDGLETCQDGTCVQGDPPDCEDGNDCTDTDCAVEQGCLYTPLDGSACADGAGICLGDTCVLSPYQCSGNSSCPVGQICMPIKDPDHENQMTLVCTAPGTGTKTAGQICTAGADCQSDTCVKVIGSEQSICWSACVSNADCAPGLLCYVNMTYFVFDQGTPDFLSDDALYSVGSCMPDLGSYIPCVGDADCPVGEFCQPGNNLNATQLEPRCLDSWTPGNGPAGQDCSTDDLCLSGICIGAPSGFCLGLCKNDLGCFGSTTCQTYDDFIVDDKNTPDDSTDDVLDAVDLCLP